MATEGEAPVADYGKHIFYSAYGWCPHCERNAGLRPGPVVEGVEERRCEDCEKVVPSNFYVTTSPGDSETPGLAK